MYNKYKINIFNRSITLTLKNKRVQAFSFAAKNSDPQAGRDARQ